MSIKNIDTFFSIKDFNNTNNNNINQDNHHNNKRFKSLIYNQDLQTTLKKKPFILQRKTYFQSQHQSNIRNHLQTHQYFQNYLLSLINQGLDNSIQHWNLITPLKNYYQSIFQIAYNYTDLQKPVIGNSSINFQQQKQPINTNVSLKIDINKLQRTTIKSQYLHSEKKNNNNSECIQSKTDLKDRQILSSLKLDYKYYKKIHQKEKLKINNQRQNSFILLVQNFRNKHEDQENQSSVVTQLRNSRLNLQNIKKKNQKRNHVLNDFKKSRFSDKRDGRQLNRSQAKAGTIFGANSRKSKNFAFDSNGELIKLKKRTQNSKFQKDQFFLDITTNNSQYHQLQNFSKHSTDKIRSSYKKLNFNVKQDNIKPQNLTDGLKFRENIMKSLHLKQGVIMKQKSVKIGHQSTHVQFKLPRI